jgi:hypothetical protein
MATDKNFGQFTTLDNTTILNSDYLVGISGIGKNSNPPTNHEQKITINDIANTISSNFKAINSENANLISGNQTQDIIMNGSDITNCANMVKAWVNFNGFGIDIGGPYDTQFPVYATWSFTGNQTSGTVLANVGSYYANFAVGQRIIVSSAQTHNDTLEPNLNNNWIVTSIIKQTSTVAGKITFNVAPGPTTGGGATDSTMTINPAPALASYNVSSIRRNAAGDYFIFFTNNLKDNFYSYAAMGAAKAGANYAININGPLTSTAGGLTNDASKYKNSVNILYQYTGTTADIDSVDISFIIFGN